MSNRGLGFAAAVFTACAPALAQHHDVIQVGRDAAGMLHMHTHAAMPFAMGPSTFPGINGFATVEVALESLIDDHPGIGLFTLDPSSDIRAVLLGAEPGIQVYGGVDPLAIGEELVLGPPYFHYMPVWNIFDGQIGEEFTLRMKFRDASGLYSESEAFDIRFVAVPAPGSALALLGLLALRRRR